MQLLMKNGAFSAVHAKEFARTIVLFKRENRRFGIKDGIEVYLDESLKRFETVYPAAGDDHSAVRLTIPELEEVSGAKGWVDVCRVPEDQQHE